MAELVFVVFQLRDVGVTAVYGVQYCKVCVGLQDL